MKDRKLVVVDNRKQLRDLSMSCPARKDDFGASFTVRMLKTMFRFYLSSVLWEETVTVLKKCTRTISRC